MQNMHSIIDVCKENMHSSEVKKICDRICGESVQSLCLREVTITDRDYKRVVKSVSVSRTVRHLSFSIGIVADSFRVQVLAKAIQINTSLTGLFLHGNSIGDAGIKSIHQSLIMHPYIISLDIGDCEIGDEGLELICSLLADSKKKRGLQELVLSHNPDITSKGWAKLGIAIAAGNSLRTLFVDYNEMGDASASCLLIAIAGTKCMENLDMECIGATEATGQVLLHLVQNYRMKFKSINLKENQISDAIMEEIKLYLPELLDADENNGQPSEDEGSLAMSEPPLDHHNLIDVVDNTKIPDTEVASTFEFPITIVGATDSVLNTPDIMYESSPDKSDGSLRSALSSNSSKSITGGSGTLAERIMSKHTTSTSNIQNDTLPVETQLRTFQSSSLDDLRKNTSVAIPDLFIQCADNDKRTYDYLTDDLNIAGNKNPTTVVEVIERIEVVENEDTRSSCSLLIHETPSVVSLHKYEENMRGHDDISFQPMEPFFTSRPSSAPASKHQKTNKQTMETNRKVSKPTGNAGDDKGENPVPVRRQYKESKPGGLSVRDTRRRLSDASVVCITKDIMDARERISSASAHGVGSKNHDFTDSSTSILGDVQVEEL